MIYKWFYILFVVWNYFHNGSRVLVHYSNVESKRQNEAIPCVLLSFCCLFNHNRWNQIDKNRIYYTNAINLVVFVLGICECVCVFVIECDTYSKWHSMPRISRFSPAVSALYGLYFDLCINNYPPIRCFTHAFENSEHWRCLQANGKHKVINLTVVKTKLID